MEVIDEMKDKEIEKNKALDNEVVEKKITDDPDPHPIYLHKLFKLKKGTACCTAWVDDNIELKGKQLINLPRIVEIGEKFYIGEMKDVYSGNRCPSFVFPDSKSRSMKVNPKELMKRRIYLNWTSSFPFTLKNVEFFEKLTEKGLRGLARYSQVRRKKDENEQYLDPEPIPLELKDLKVGLEFFTVWHDPKEVTIELKRNIYKVKDIKKIDGKLYLVCYYKKIKRSTEPWEGTKEALLTEEVLQRGFCSSKIRTFEDKYRKYLEKLKKENNVKKYLEIINN